ncbi:MAG TPA: radical SAM protein [Candidatus Woesebacteria bacterium]|nr:radical SAM protein [Candidatus Woesebacteria bacterium]
MKKILLINLGSTNKNINRDMAGGLGYSAGEGVVLPPMDLLLMATDLQKKKFIVDFVDLLAEKNNDNIEILKYDYVIASLSLPTIEEDIAWMRDNTQKYNKTKFIFKTGINYLNILKNVKRNSGVDLILSGEFDLVTDEYLNKEGICFGKAIKDLDQLPLPNRKLLNNQVYKYPLLDGVVTTVQTSRGCPFPCSYYCPYPLVQGKQWRSMSAIRVVKEIKDIKKLGINNVLFRDATFTYDNERVRKICQLIIKNKLRINWWCETRINVLNEDLLKIMKKAGCSGINVGIETLSNDLLKKEGKPGISVFDVININKIAKKINLKLHFLMIVGLPNDNIEGLFETFLYIKKLQPNSIGVTSITPYPGTELFEYAKKNKLISNYQWENFNGEEVNMKTNYLNYFEIGLARKLLIIEAILNKQSKIFKNIGLEVISIIFKIWIQIKKFQ